jgi:hypothetical protein
MWKKETGKEEPITRVPPGSFTITPLIVYRAFVLEGIRIPGSIVSKYLEI